MRNSEYISRRRKRELQRPEQTFVYGWSLNNEKLDREIRAKLDEMQVPQNYLTEYLGVARSTFWRIYKGHEITMPTFLKLMEWLEADINDYIIKN